MSELNTVQSNGTLTLINGKKYKGLLIAKETEAAFYPKGAKSPLVRWHYARLLRMDNIRRGGTSTLMTVILMDESRYIFELDHGLKIYNFMDQHWVDKPVRPKTRGDELHRLAELRGEKIEVPKHHLIRRRHPNRSIAGDIGIYLMLVILTLCLFVGTTVDLLAKPRLRIHTEPKDLIAHVDAFWKTKSKEPVSVVVGDQWEATFCENYMPGRPPACPLTDPVSIRLHRDLIREKGALLIGSPEEFTDFLREFGHPEIEFTEFRIEFQTRIGKKKSKRLQVAYLPPQGQL